MQITGAELFVKALQKEQIHDLFAYPGGQVIDLFDALYQAQDIRVVQPRHEQGLIHAADGYARLLGKTGVCLVTSGPGAANLVTGIATANADSVPLVCFAGQVPTDLIGNTSFQEVDIVSVTSSITKWAVSVRRREQLGAVIRRAFQVAAAGRPGVVVVELPKDIQQAMGSSHYPKQPEDCASDPAPQIQPLQVKKALDFLAGARRPLFLFGGGVHLAQAQAEVTKLAEITGIPVITTIMGKGAIPTDHPLYIGNVGIHGSYAANMAVNECDVLFSIGARMNDRVTGKADGFAPHARIICIDIDRFAVSGKIHADLPIVSDAKAAAAVFLAQADHVDTRQWRRKISGWAQAYPLSRGWACKEGVTPYQVIKEINALFQDAVIVSDVGQNQMWTAQFLEITGRTRLLTSGGMGTMGYGLPAAIGARLGSPDRDVLAICGDGGIQMNIQELATAVVYELPVIICVMNNDYLGNVRQWQELFYGGRYSGTCMRRRKCCPSACSRPGALCPQYTPDFVKLAESYGAKGIRVDTTQEIRAALLCAKQETEVPTLIEFKIRAEENVWPIVPAGKSLQGMVMGEQ